VKWVRPDDDIVIKSEDTERSSRRLFLQSLLLADFVTLRIMRRMTR